MIKKIYTLFLVLLLSAVSFAQVDDTPIMQYWVGGTLNMDMAFQGNMNGPGMGSGIFAGIVSPGIRNGASAMYSNPAELSFLKSPQLLFDTRMMIGTHTLGISDSEVISEETLTDGSDDFLTDTTTFKLPASSYRKDTQLGGVNIYQPGGVTSLSFALPLSDRLVVGFGYNSLMQFDMNMLVSGIMTNIKTEKQIGNSVTPIDMLLNSSLSMQMTFRMSSMSLSAGYRLFQNENNRTLSVGIAFNRYTAFHQLNNKFNSDGMMVISNSTEYYFNDPSDNVLDFNAGETNSFYWETRGNFEAVQWGGRLGMYYYFGDKAKFFSNFKLSLVYDLMPEMTLSDDNAFSRSYQPKFLTGRPLGEDEETMDIIIDSIDIAKPNLTVETFNSFGNSVRVNMPSSLTFGMDISLGKHLFAFNYVSYSGELSYQMDKFKFGKKATSGVRFGLDFHFPDKFKGASWLLLPLRVFFLDLDGAIFQLFAKQTGYKNPHYRYGIALMNGEPIVEGFNNEDTQSLTDALDIPLITGFSMSRTYTIYENIDIGVLVFGFPEMMMRFSFGYNF
ncbi:MAG: hypothetical protein SCALA702_37220 [Melioribacteraceae bacterium]|nr:MAG: hypothetical protein SCALA702_37220 [Melioribacteraceae bacterium]